MSLSSETAAALAELESDHADFVTLGSAEYPCLASVRGSGKDLALGGFELDADLTLVVRTALLAPADVPVLGRTLIHNGITYRIERIRTWGPFLRLVCLHPHR